MSVPKLRFTEFEDTGEWKEPCGDELFEPIVNKDHNSDLPILAISQEYGAIPRHLIDYQVSVTEKSIESYKVVEVGDFIISLRSFQGGIEYSEYKGICSPAYIILRKKSDLIGSLFFKYYFKTDKYIKDLNRNLEGLRDGKMVSYSQFSEIQLPFPSLPEQQKIADCLSSLDDLIAAHKQKLDILKTHKKGLMQQLFPAEGEIVPRLRFPEFENAGEWQLRCLKDFISERNQMDKNGLPLYSLTIESGIVPKTERYERSFLVKDEEDAYKEVHQFDFAFNPMNLRFGALAMHHENRKVAVSKYYNIFYCDSSVNSVFSEIYFKSERMIKYYDKMATGSLIEKRRVLFLDFLEFSILFPSLPEQQKIAECLSALDVMIAAQSGKIESLTLHKKGLMQQLFPQGEA